MRSCYETKFRFFRDSDVETVVRWFFTDKPMLPFEHSFTSRNWLGEPDQHDGLGEVYGADRKWVNGAAPGEFPTEHICGTREQWLSGESLPPVPQVPVTADIIPLCCLDTYDSRGWFADWSHERKFGENFGVNLSINVFWGIERFFSHFDVPFPSYRLFWGLLRNFRPHEYPDYKVAPVWLIERTWNPEVVTTPDVRPLWDIERQWIVSVQTGEEVSALWDIERDWAVVLAEDITDEPEWSEEVSLEADILTEEVVTSFDCGGQVAAGTNQATATVVGHDNVMGTSTGAGQGFILPTGCYRICIMNNNALGGNSINVYPPTGTKIDQLTVNTALALAPQQCTLFISMGGTHYRYVNLT